MNPEIIGESLDSKSNEICARKLGQLAKARAELQIAESEANKDVIDDAYHEVLDGMSFEASTSIGQIEPDLLFVDELENGDKIDFSGWFISLHLPVNEQFYSKKGEYTMRYFIEDIDFSLRVATFLDGEIFESYPAGNPEKPVKDFEEARQRLMITNSLIEEITARKN